MVSSLKNEIGLFLDLPKDSKRKGLLLEGFCGLGKTFSTISTLKAKKLDFEYLAGHITPAMLYLTLLEHQESILFLDDVTELLNSKTNCSLLLSALGFPGKVTWKSTRDLSQSVPVDFPVVPVPKSFLFKGKVVIVLNHVPSKLSGVIRALSDRCHSIEFKPDFKARLALCRRVAKRSKPRGKRNVCLKAVLLAERFKVVDVTLRDLEFAWDLHRVRPGSWESLWLKTKGVDDRHLFYLQLEKRALSVAEMQGLFCKRFDCSDSTFKRLRQRLKQ